MSRVINIAGLTPVDDPEYRYKMPSVVGKVEGRGNGIKTVIFNVVELAESLHRDPGEVTKFFGCDLGAQTTWNADTERGIVNGAHTDVVLQQLVSKYIENFVLCPSCRLPETQYKIKNEIIYHKCAACGAKESADMAHKLCTYILAQHKKKKKEKAKDDKKKGKDKDGKKKDKDKDKDKDKESKKKDKKDKKERKEKKEKKEKGGALDAAKAALEESKPPGDDAVSAANHLTESIFGKKHSLANESSDDDDDDAAKGVENLSMTDESALDAAVKATSAFVEANPEASPNDVVEVVKNQQMASALKSHQRIAIFMKAVISNDFYKTNAIGKHKAVLLKLTASNSHIMRHAISAAEELCVSSTKLFPVMIKQLYDEDVVDEESILTWYAADGADEYRVVSEGAGKEMRKKAEVVVRWLEEAEEDDSDEDDDDGE